MGEFIMGVLITGVIGLFVIFGTSSWSYNNGYKDGIKDSADQIYRKQVLEREFSKNN